MRLIFFTPLLIGAVCTPKPKTLEPAAFNADGCREIGGRNFSVEVDRATKLENIPCVVGSVYLRKEDRNVLKVPKLRQIGGDLVIEDTAMRQITFPDLELVQGTLRIENNPRLERVIFPKLGIILDGLVIKKNARFLGFELAPDAKISRIVSVVDADGMEDLAGLSQITRIDGDLEISGNEKLKDVSGLAALKEITGTFTFDDNDRVEALVLPNLTVLGSLEVNDSDTMRTLEMTKLLSTEERIGLTNDDALERVSFPELRVSKGSVDLAALYALKELDAPQLGKVNGDFGLVDCPALVTFGAPALSEITDDLVVRTNGGLTGFAFPKLKIIGGYLTLTGNAALKSLEGLGALRKVGVQLFIQDNAKLPTCAVTALAEQQEVERLWPDEVANNDDAAKCAPAADG